MTGGTTVGADVLRGPHTRVEQPAERARFASVLEALDPDRMGPLLTAALGAESGTPCLVVDAKYEPGRAATVLYRLGGGLVHATVPAPGGRAPGRSLPNGMVVSRFPADPGLPTLGQVLDPATFGAALGREVDLPADFGVETRLLRYRPGRRATLLVTTAAAAGEATYVAKVYHDGAKAAAVAAEGRALHTLGLPPPLVLAPVVAHLPDLAVVVQGHLPGHELAFDLADPHVVVRREPDVVRAARALAALHSGTVPAGRPRPVERELHRFVDRATAICGVDPSGGEPLLALARDLLEWRPTPGPVSLVHGDCKPSQFLVDGDRVALLDLDHCGIAETAYDVGNLVASLRQTALREGVPGTGRDVARTVVPSAARAAEALGATFATAYLDSVGPARRHEVSAGIDFYVVVSLLRKALRAWARSPLAALPGLLVEDARRAASDAGLGKRA